MKLILSLSGGGKRGILYSKLIPEIQKQHEIIGVYGVSIGAIVGFAIMTNIDLTTLFKLIIQLVYNYVDRVFILINVINFPI